MPGGLHRGEANLKLIIGLLTDSDVLKVPVLALTPCSELSGVDVFNLNPLGHLSLEHYFCVENVFHTIIVFF